MKPRRDSGRVRRLALAAVVAGCAGLVAAPPVLAQQAATAFPIYRAEHVLQGLYTHWAPGQWRSFEQAAAALTDAARQHCAGQAPAAALEAAWTQARLAWMAASTPAIGPALSRRSQRSIDFWPLRPALLQRVLASPPQSLADMARVGGPAKGFPALEALLADGRSSAACPYPEHLAASIAAEAGAVAAAVAAQSAQDWPAQEDLARQAFAEWVNQWLGGLESLRWQQLEQPILKARSAGGAAVPAFARRRMADNLADWRAQWASLRAQAVLAPAQRTVPPVPGEAIIPVAALLLGKGHIALAGRWVAAVDAASAAMAALPAQPTAPDLLALAQRLKQVGTLYQAEVAAALDVPLGFSSADGD